MKIFNFSLDQNLLNQESAVSQRLVSLGQITERYLIMVPTRFDRSLDLSDKVSVLGVGGKIKIQILIRIFIQAYKILKQDHYDLITVQDTYFLALVAWILERRFKLPLEIQVHGFERFRLIRKILARFLLARATGVRVVSQRLKEQLITEFKIPLILLITITDITSSATSSAIITKGFLALAAISHILSISLTVLIGMSASKINGSSYSHILLSAEVENCWLEYP